MIGYRYLAPDSTWEDAFYMTAITLATVGFGDVPVVLVDPTSDDTLIQAGVERAARIAECTENDKENLVVTLSARQLNPRIRIVSRVSDIATENKVRKWERTPWSHRISSEPCVWLPSSYGRPS